MKFIPATKQQNRTSSLCLLLALLLLSTPSMVRTSAAQLVTTGVYVGNQGNFSDANGTVTYYSPASGEVILDAIPNLNSLVQNIVVDDNTGYIVANTSDRIDLFDVRTNMRTGQITEVSGPRFMSLVGEDKAYVTNLFANTVTILDLTSNEIAGTINTGTNPEDIALAGSSAFVSNNGFGFGNTLTQIDTAADMVSSTIDLGCDGPRTLEVDGQQEVWVVCTGKTVYNSDFTEIIEQTNGQVLVLTDSGEIIERFTMDAQLGTTAAGQDSFYDPVMDQLFVIKGTHVVRFNTSTNTQEEAIELQGDAPLGGVAFDAAAGLIYAARIPDYTSTGYVSLHTLEGMETDRFTTGIAPASITLIQTGTSVAQEDFPRTPRELALTQNYPNPFTTSTTIAFELANTSPVTVKVFDVLGAEVATVTQATYPAGRHEVTWDATGLPAGVYVYRLKSGSQTTTRLMTRYK